VTKVSKKKVSKKKVSKKKVSTTELIGKAQEDSLRLAINFYLVEVFPIVRPDVKLTEADVEMMVTFGMAKLAELLRKAA
jgi:hypothetical protein